MAFSGALTLTDLDDFLSPSQACILPVRQTNKVKGQEEGVNSGETEIHIDAQNNYYEVAIATKPSTAAQPTSISLLPSGTSSSSSSSTLTPSPNGLDRTGQDGGSNGYAAGGSSSNGPLAAPGLEKGMDSNGKAEVGIISSSSTNFNAAGPSSNGTAQQLQKAEISLNDCLACSGCVTSTESMLITLQSHLEVQMYIDSRVRFDANGRRAVAHTDVSNGRLEGIDRGVPSGSLEEQLDGRTGVISISPQTLASLSASYYPAASSTSSTGQNPPTLRLLRRIRAFLRRPENGAWAGVWDTTFARHLSLKEHLREFRQRRDMGKGKGREVITNGNGNGPGPMGKETALEGDGLPMLASACPGWVCYAEKAHGDLLPYMAATRSSQGIMGGLVKQYWAGGTRPGGKRLEPEEIYHVTVMPCYDKKLEASRSDFYNEQRKTRDADCVLTTGELEVLLRERGFDPYESVEGEDEEMPAGGQEDCPYPELLQHPGSSSGSYLQTLLDALAAEHPGPTSTTTRQIRASDDHVEYILTDATTGEVLFKGAKCYGFRNLQNLVRKIGRETGVKSGKGVGGGAGRLTAAVVARRRAGRASRAGGVAKVNGDLETPLTTDSEASTTTSSTDAETKSLDYVEVMACPGGCVNGGGQVKPSAPAAKKESPVDKDEEGFQRAWEKEGVETVKPQVDESMRWSTKAWVAQVEEMYWSGLPTPPASPSACPPVDDPLSARLTTEERKRHRADVLADEIIREVSESTVHTDWDPERRRQEVFRTRYRKVESDITSLAAVKW